MSGNDDVMLVSEWEDLTVAQLKEELVGRGLETTGRKADLVARLEANDREILDAQGHQQQGEEEEGTQNKEEDNGDDDLVVWADDEAGQEEDQLVLDDDEEKPAADSSAAELKPKVETLEKPQKEEFHVDVSKDKDLFILTWHGQKVAIPFKDEIQKDIKHCVKMQNIIMYPAEIADVYSETVKPLVEKAINVSMELDETVPGKPIKGYLRLKFGSASVAASAMESLKEYKPDEREITLENFGENDSEGHVLSKVKSKDTDRRDPLLHRLMFVSNLPSDATEETLLVQFQDALRVIIPAKKEEEETSEMNGYAYVEYPSEAETVEAVAQHKDMELGGQKLYIIKSMTERKETFGLLRDSLRKYWLEQIKTLEGVKAKPHNKSVRELQELDTKLLRLKKRISKDNKKRLELGLPVPEGELFDVPEGDSDKEDAAEKPKEKDRERTPSSSRKERRRSPPPRRRYSPSRSRSNYRYSSRGSSSFRGGPPSVAPRADHLMNQLQELVGALSGGRGGGYYDGPRGGGRGGGGYGGGPSYGRDYASGGSSRYGGKRPGDMEYGGDRKRRLDDYSGYDGGRSGGGGGGGYGSFGGSHRGGYNY